ncbi:threonine ammonia-lyase [Salibacterium aidingense]|uniref:threonine ammonia-lyase n=1 Tax=Salibacterium aidingense TaxID=384933 RepID=UPI000688ADE4|nr:threonine/serine dehydratase [Salibacterium aidingense]
MNGQRLETVALTDFKTAKQRLTEIIPRPTPLIQNELLNMELGSSIFIKAESLLPVGSFKLRGAFNKIASLAEKKTQPFKVVTASAGNHAMGVSYASSVKGAEANVVVPETTPAIKINTCEAFGAVVHKVGATYDEAYQYARELSEEMDGTYVHPVADADVVAGQGTIALELLEQLPKVDQIIVPLGGGGLVSGIAMAAKNLNSSIQVIAVQAEGSAAYYESFTTGEMKTLTETNTLAEGLSVKKPEPYLLSFINDWVDDVIKVKEKTIREAVKLFALSGKLVVEASGTVPLAAVMEEQIAITKNTVVIASGSNIDESVLKECLFKQK